MIALALSYNPAVAQAPPAPPPGPAFHSTNALRIDAAQAPRTDLPVELIGREQQFSFS